MLRPRGRVWTNLKQKVSKLSILGRSKFPYTYEPDRLVPLVLVQSHFSGPQTIIGESPSVELLVFRGQNPDISQDSFGGVTVHEGTFEVGNAFIVFEAVVLVQESVRLTDLNQGTEAAAVDSLGVGEFLS